MTRLPDPTCTHPIVLPDGTPHLGTVFLANVAAHPRMEVGAYTYASDFDPPADWVGRLAPYLFPFSQERLTIGKFCQIAHGVRFLTSSANHAMQGLSCYPFAIFDETARAGFQPDHRDTVIGHDVWLGHGAQVLPGARIGHGAIIGAGAVVRGTIPPYAIVTGTPGKVDRFRFDPETITRLLDLAWWDWPDDKINANLDAIQSGKFEDLAR
ncbi:MAG: CatB-related O-acetyltransferase [Pelagimonas sp.]|jgi:virginiamycin A acetyltransferase|nr:CatB-related O-acetyltransferase [Pelagimonas sp.]